MAIAFRRLGPALLTALLVLPLTLTGVTYRHAVRAPVVIHVAGCWPDTYQGSQFVKIAQSYSKAQSGIKVVASYAATPQQVLTAETAGKPPDVFFDCSNGDVGTWASTGVVLNLEPLIKKYHFDTGRFTDSANKLIRYNGRAYAMPYLTCTFMLLYNKTLFRRAHLDPNKPPRTWEQVQALWKPLTLRNSSGKITSLAMLPTYGGPDYVGTWLPVYMTTFGGHLVSSDGKKVTANCPQCVQALTWEANYYKTIGASNVDRFGAYGNPPVGSPQNLFLSGKIAMYVSGEWNPKFIAVYGPKHFDYGVAPLPYPAAHPELANSGMANGNMGFIMRKSRHPDEAFKFLMWVQTVEPTVRFANVINNVPHIKAALNNPGLPTDPHYRAFVHYAGTAHLQIFPNLPISSEYAAALTSIEDRVIHGRMSPKAGLDKVTHDMQTLLEQKTSGI